MSICLQDLNVNENGVVSMYTSTALKLEFNKHFLPPFRKPSNLNLWSEKQIEWKVTTQKFASVNMMSTLPLLQHYTSRGVANQISKDLT